MIQPAVPKFSILSAPMSGAHLIDASAGTGKTYTISSLFVRLVIEKRLTVDNVLVVTYTKAATEDLRTRIREKLQQALVGLEKGHSDDTFLSDLIAHTKQREDAVRCLQEALRNFDEAAIFTIHGFCQRMLRENGLESSISFDSELVADVDAMYHEVALDFWRHTMNRCSPGFIRFASKKMAPPALCSLMKKFRPEITLLPDISDKTTEEVLENIEVSAKEKVFCEQLENIQAVWRLMKNEIEEILLQFEGFKQNSYSKEIIQKLFKEMESVCTCTQVLPGNVPPCLIKFASRTIRKGTKKKYTPPDHLFFDRCEELFSVNDEVVGMYRHLLCALQQSSMRFGFSEMRKRKEKQGVLSFDDLLLLLGESLAGQNGDRLAATIRRKYPAALIDEFQDTDPIQYSIFSSVYRGGDNTLLYIIGDPKQAIYSFRGADIFTYKKAIHEISSKMSLEENYRSDPGLISAVNAVFQGVADPFCDEDISFSPVNAAVIPERDSLTVDGVKESCLQICFTPREELDKGKLITKPQAELRILRTLSGEIQRLLHLGEQHLAKIGDQPISPRDIAVLVRTNREAQLVKDALEYMKIPSVLQGSADLFLSREAWEFERVLEAVADPGSEKKIRSALATDMLGGTCQIFMEFDRDQDFWAERLRAFHTYHELWQKRGFIRMARVLFAAENVHCQCLRFNDGERRLTNILHLSEVLHQYEKETCSGISEIIHYLGIKREGGEEAVEEHQLRLESDADRVQIITTHRSKGLQYPIVFCPFAWGGSRLSAQSMFTFHIPGEEMQPAMDLGSDERESHLQLAKREELAENIRLLYVALTRAKYRSYLYWGPFNKGESSALAWLFHRDMIDPSPSGIAKRFKKLTDDEFIKDLQPLVDRGNGDIQLTWPSEGKEYGHFGMKKMARSLTCRSLQTKISSRWQVTSFSGMIKHAAGSELPDRDFSVREENISPGTDRSIYSFPRGAGAGTFMHDLLENLNFGDIAAGTGEMKKYVFEKIEQYGYGLEWTDTILVMLNNVVQTPLLVGFPELMLKKIERKQRLSELEFYFSLDRVSKQSLVKLLSAHGIDERIGKRLEFFEVEGFLKGFIDLVFEYDGRYYLLDWKSNHLGRRVEDYRKEVLSNVMVEEAYVLQYLLYTVALHQYLAVRIPNYSYEKEFGGIFYLFLRGMNPDNGSEYGVYHDIPSVTLIEEMSELLVKSEKSLIRV